MRRFRFHIGTLIILVLVLGASFAALRESNEIWDSGIFTLALVILLTSVMLAIHRTEERRAFWVGFALFGWTYLALSLVPSIESRLATAKALAYLDSKVPGRTQGLFKIQFSATGTPGNRLTTSNLGTVKVWDAATGRLLGGWAGSTENFVRIGHSLFALMAGWFGGLLSHRLWRASSVTDASTPVHVEGTDP
jgi:hypothetical protein